MSDFVIDWERERRTGVPEAVLCASKSAAQVEAILKEAAMAGRRLLFTRLEPAAFEALAPECRAMLDHDALSRTAWCGPLPPAGPCGTGSASSPPAPPTCPSPARPPGPSNSWGSRPR
ncbi:hypothetical protein [Skermanella pratensis]|uniref:hypothetical protein n=1 Tax=Skermanella pratensis TaxID=2233999 RepID=UPI001FE4A3B2|nr:hypothetical protein [Skermanella pratensis]